MVDPPYIRPPTKTPVPRKPVIKPVNNSGNQGFTIKPTVKGS